MDSLLIAVVVGLIVLYLAFKVFKMAMKFALLVALGAAAFAGYTAYVAT